MNTIWFSLVAILGVTAALPVNNLDEEAILQMLTKTDDLGRNNALENILIDMLENVRNIMVTGNDDIPVLDPFTQDRVFVDDSTIPVPGAHIELIDLTVSNLSRFELNTVSVWVASIIMQRYNVEVDAEIPAIEVDVGKHNFFGSVDGLSLFGAGDAKIVIVKPRIKVNLLVGVRFGLAALYLNIVNTRIEISLADIQPAFTGMFHNPAVDGFVNLFLRNLVLEFMDSFSEEITDTVSPMVQDAANNVLRNLNLIDLIN